MPDRVELPERLLQALRWIGKRRARREHRQWLEAIAPLCEGFADKVVLEVGSDLSGMLLGILAQRFSPRQAVGLNLGAVERSISPTVRLDKGDIRATRYADATFDVILSTSAFEHISGLDRAMAEMRRILKPGGYLFSHFGPIWSCSYGHHLWLRDGVRLYNYWNVILPPFCHLLESREEIEDRLAREGYAPGLARRIGEFVTASNEQNRLFFEDYESIFAASGFEVLVCKGHDSALSRKYNPRITPQLLDRLRSRYPGKRHFLYEGITTLMRKPRA